MPSEDADEVAAGSPKPDRSESDAAVEPASAAEPTESTAGRAELVSEPSDAFQALGNEIRMGILETMLDRTDGENRSRTPFSELFEDSDVDTSAGFAYHLEQLVGPYLRKYDDGYELTYAGERIARAIATGTYTRRVDLPPVPLDDPCPFCDGAALEARSTDNVVTVACDDCDRALLRLGFPPAGLEAHGRDFPAAFDRHHRHRLALFRDGVCPDCSGAVTAGLVTPSADVADALPEELATHVQAEFECGSCGTAVRCPVSLALLEHPAIVSFYHERGEAVRDRPIWNVGHEWAERVLSEEPLAVRVVVELDSDVLALYVDERLTVVDVQRAAEETTD
ncbi:Lar family restriction alleviation protein [Halosolutus gelatinilyticus]|uniref:Lar family restriction alleviation protein n=1 Tax=Halosolutus gelatinilyticus TaxID=2931975 RepID=UPI001FF3406F|nr:Lar family restriction alleviation protein [Halosolutus gelatinilyticus]